MMHGTMNVKSIYVIYAFLTICQIITNFLKSRSLLQILGSRRVIRSKFHNSAVTFEPHLNQALSAGRMWTDNILYEMNKLQYVQGDQKVSVHLTIAL
jgi:hypothetical protein